MIETDYAYLAGIMDGEGSFMITRRKSGFMAVRASVTNTNYALVEWFQKSGLRYRLNTRTVRPTSKPFYQITIEPTELRKLLPKVTPHLVLKAKQADILSKALDLTKLKMGQSVKMEELRKEMQALNHRGV